MKTFKDVNYNIFEREGGKYEGLVFDQYRRILFKTHLRDTREEAIDESHRIIKSYRKGFCMTSCGGIFVDEGKPIREKILKDEKERKEQEKNNKV
jgi:hypothetical protein